MTYGLNAFDFIENGPAAMAIRARSSQSTARFWHALNANRRLAIVEQTLRAANDDSPDGFPLAL